LAASLNKGIRAARGKYIARMDADDISREDRFEKQFRVLETNPEYHVCVTPIQLFGKQNTIFGRGYRTDEQIKAELVWNTPVTHGTMLFLTEKIKKHNLFYDESFGVGQDWKFWMDVRDHVKIYLLDELLYHYRISEQNVSFNSDTKKRQMTLRMHRLLLTELQVNYSEEDLLLHQYVNGVFYLDTNLKTLRAANTWYRNLVSQNNKLKKYDTIAFSKIADMKWNRMLFLIAPYGIKMVLGYMLISGIRPEQIKYLVKFYLNKLLGKSTEQPAPKKNFEV
jgi:glycosyltransferase involved in cell wall biosynthesis